MGVSIGFWEIGQVHRCPTPMHTCNAHVRMLIYLLFNMLFIFVLLSNARLSLFVDSLPDLLVVLAVINVSH